MTYISPNLPDMIRNLWRSDPSENSARTALTLAGDLIQELIDLRQAIARVRKVHAATDALNMHTKTLEQVCIGCGQDNGNWNTWPCPTIQALNEKGTSK